MILSMADEKIVGDDDPCHWTKKHAPPTENSDEGAGIPEHHKWSVNMSHSPMTSLLTENGSRHIIPWTDGYCYQRQDVAASSNVDPSRVPKVSTSRKAGLPLYFPPGTTHFGQRAAMSIPVEMPFNIWQRASWSTRKPKPAKKVPARAAGVIEFSWMVNSNSKGFQIYSP